MSAVWALCENDMTLREYCEQTSLHGWFYIFSADKKLWKTLWSLIVTTSIAVASVFVYKASEEFRKATVMTTIHSTTTPLSEVFFPAVTVCNINQVRKSFFNDLGIQSNVSIVDLLYEQFYTGSEADPTPQEQVLMKTLFTSEVYVRKEYLYHQIASMGNNYSAEAHRGSWTEYLKEHLKIIETGFQFPRLAVQEPQGIMILRASYGEDMLYGNYSDFNPLFGTDYGICSCIKPQIAFNKSLTHVPYWKKIFGTANWAIEKGAEVGKANGLSLLLDAETFDYTFHLKAGEGFKIAVHHHLDQPILSLKEVDISPGSVFQVAVTPTLMSTTPEAISRFSPRERGCYVEKELPLKYLPERFYRYEMSNCLFEAAYERVLKECRCLPSFHAPIEAIEDGYNATSTCKGPSLSCMKRILGLLGKLNTVGEDNAECLSGCEDQINSVSVTSSSFPNRETLVRREEFCLIVLKLIKTCNSAKRVLLTEKFPRVCLNIESATRRVSSMSGSGELEICEGLKWSPLRWGFDADDELVKLIEDDIFNYARKNLALLNVYIKDPVVTKIMRDQKIPVIAFVANTGGLLGLCMGFSLVSVFEILYHAVGALKRIIAAPKGHRQPELSTNAATTTTASASSVAAGANNLYVAVNSCRCEDANRRSKSRKQTLRSIVDPKRSSSGVTAQTELESEFSGTREPVSEEPVRENGGVERLQHRDQRNANRDSRPDELLFIDDIEIRSDKSHKTPSESPEDGEKLL